MVAMDDVIDHHGRNLAHAHRWHQAATLADLGELTAQWLTGAIGYLPGYFGGSPDAETDGLTHLLAAVNRAGFVTNFSQPGDVDGDWVQRAAVSGFCSAATAQRLQEAALDTDLVVIASDPIYRAYSQIPVTREGQRENTWIGAGADDDELDDTYEQEVGSAALAALKGAWQLDIFDSAWGRNDVLWPWLQRFAGL
jgi:hypothetical protein